MISGRRQSNGNSCGIPTIAVIGCGALAEQYYLPVLANIPAVMTKSILIDKYHDRARKMAGAFGAHNWGTDFHEFVDEVDGAIIAAPTNLHHPIAMEFLSRGKSVLCEKPLAENAGQGRAMVAAAVKNGAVLAVNYLQRLIPVFAKVKELINNKTYGEIRSIHYFVRERFDWPSVSGFYFNSPVSARGILRDRGAHALDHICWWLGAKPTVRSSRNDSFGGSDAVATVEFEHGNCTGQLGLSWVINLPSNYKVEFDDATILGDVYDYRNMALENPGGRRRDVVIRSKHRTKNNIASSIIDNFLDVFRIGSPPLISGKDVLPSLELADECYALAKQFDMPWYDFLGGWHE